MGIPLRKKQNPRLPFNPAAPLDIPYDYASSR